MQNLLYKVYRWLHYVLYEETDDSRIAGKQLRAKRVLHNALLMQVWAACSIIVGLPLAVVIVCEIFTIPYALLAYMIVCTALSLFFYYGRRHEKMKEKDYYKTMRSATDDVPPY